MLYSVNKPAMRKALDMAKKTMGNDDATSSGFRLSGEEKSKHDPSFGMGSSLRSNLRVAPRHRPCRRRRREARPAAFQESVGMPVECWSVGVLE